MEWSDDVIDLPGADCQLHAVLIGVFEKLRI